MLKENCLTYYARFLRLSGLKMPNLGRRRLIVVITSIVIGNRGIDQLIHIHTFKAREADGVELSTRARIFSPSE
jgi:hypothetical protein